MRRARPNCPYIVGAALLLPALFLLRAPDTVEGRSGGLRTGVKPQRLGVPREIRGPFAAAAIGGFVGFALLGFVTALVGNFLGQGLADHSHQTAGVVAFLVFAAGTLGQLLAGRISARTASLGGSGGAAGRALVLITLALPAKSLALFLVGAMVGGAAVGFAFRAAVLTLNTIAPPDRRAEVLSTFFVVAYIGITVPVVGTGLLLTTHHAAHGRRHAGGLAGWPGGDRRGHLGAVAGNAACYATAPATAPNASSAWVRRAGRR